MQSPFEKISVQSNECIVQPISTILAHLQLCLLHNSTAFIVSIAVPWTWSALLHCFLINGNSVASLKHVSILEDVTKYKIMAGWNQEEMSCSNEFPSHACSQHTSCPFWLVGVANCWYLWICNWATWTNENIKWLTSMTHYFAIWFMAPPHCWWPIIHEIGECLEMPIGSRLRSPWTTYDYEGRDQSENE